MRLALGQRTDSRARRDPKISPDKIRQVFKVSLNVIHFAALLCPNTGVPCLPANVLDPALRLCKTTGSKNIGSNEYSDQKIRFDLVLWTR